MDKKVYDNVKSLILEKRFDTALKVLELEPQTETETLYLQALALRGAGRIRDALAALDEILRLHPGHARAFQERGHILREAGDLNAALSAYGRATQENPSLFASWRAQVEILLAAGRHAEAERLKPHIQRLANMPKPLVYALDMLSQGFIAVAEEHCRQFLKQYPHHVEAMRLLADIGTRLNVFDEAEFLLESALMFEPDNASVKLDYIAVLRKRQKLHEALEHAEALLRVTPQNIQYRSLVAIISMQTGDYDRALGMFDDVLQEIPGEPVTLTSKGHALKTIGKTDEAILCYREACRDGVVHGEAWQSLANLKTYRFTDDEVARMRKLVSGYALRNMDRVYLYFALGKALEDRKSFDEAFEMYAQGNQIKRNESKYVAAHMTEEFEEQRKIFDKLKLRGTGCTAPDPIFILGMPRAGSTLLEQILSSHSLVDGTQELPNILSYVHQIRNRDKRFNRLNYPRGIESLTPEELHEFGERYVAETASYRGSAPFFIDKMPNNFRHIGLIKLILPKAKIIDARRHPLSCAFSCYKQLFAEGQEFSYDLSDLGLYYRDYVRLMDYWHARFPDSILHVQYEDVVDNLEEQVRRILDYCELPFEAACTRYWETERAVRTPSSEQVRKPIFKSGVENWQQFEAHLEPLKIALGESLEQYRPSVTL